MCCGPVQCSSNCNSSHIDFFDRLTGQVMIEENDVSHFTPEFTSRRTRIEGVERHFVTIPVWFDDTSGRGPADCRRIEVIVCRDANGLPLHLIAPVGVNERFGFEAKALVSSACSLKRFKPTNQARRQGSAPRRKGRKRSQRHQR